MKWWLIEGLELRGLPAFWVPGYGVLVGVASVLAAVVVLRLGTREGADRRTDATAMLVAYVGALAGGYAYEWLRVTPQALAELSWSPYSHVGRAAYGGLLFAVTSAALYLRHRGASIGPFLDRCAVVIGLIFALVRLGCLLEGCDYGHVTAGFLGFRYPPGAPAALDHVALGWVPAGAPSLPVHLTQVYEGLGALLASALASAVRAARLERDAFPAGAAFAAWLACYAVVRALVELLRADAERGLYAGLSTASWTSLGLLVAVAAWLLLRRARAVAPSVMHDDAVPALDVGPRADARREIGGGPAQRSGAGDR